MSLYGIAGLTGGGKTYIMTRWGIDALKKAKPDVLLYACYHINYAPLQDRIKYFNTVRDFVDMENAIVLIDEASIWFNSRNWNNLDPQVQYKILQHRKDGLRIYATAQFWDGVDKYVRQNAHKYFEVNKVMGSDETEEKVWGLITVREYPPRFYDKIRRPTIRTNYYLIRKKYIDLYNTFEKVIPVTKLSKKKTEDKAVDNVLRHENKLLLSRIEQEKELTVKRQRGRPRKIKIVAG